MKKTILSSLFFSIFIIHSLITAEINFSDIDPLNSQSLETFICQSFSTPANPKEIKIENLNGLSIWAKSYKVINQQTAEEIALRVLNPKQPQKNRETEMLLIEKMSEAAIAPLVLNMDNNNGLISTVFIKSPEQRPWHPLSMTANKIVQFASSIKLLHEQPISYFENTKFNELDEKVIQLADSFPQFQLFKTGIEKMLEIDAIQSPYIELKFSHNDLGHGGNTLWDGEKVWLIDWELAGYFNPYFDVASPMVLLFFSEDFKNLFFETYLGHPPSQKEKDLLFINLQYAYLRYGVTSLGICHEPEKAFNLSPSEIDGIGVWSDILIGRVSLKHEELQTDLGRCKIGILLIKQALKNMDTDEFKSAVSRLNQLNMGK